MTDDIVGHPLGGDQFPLIRTPDGNPSQRQHERRSQDVQFDAGHIPVLLLTQQPVSPVLTGI